MPTSIEADFSHITSTVIRLCIEDCIYGIIAGHNRAVVVPVGESQWEKQGLSDRVENSQTAFWFYHVQFESIRVFLGILQEAFNRTSRGYRRYYRHYTVTA